MRAIDGWVENPESEAIAAELNKDMATLCVHHRDPCYLRCGVRDEHTFQGHPRWVVIPHAERLRWKRRVFGEEP